MSALHQGPAFDEIKLGDAVTFQRGFDITKNEQSAGDVPIVSSSGVSSFHSQWKTKGPGVVIGRKGTLGSVHYLKDKFWPHDTTLWVKDFKGNNPRFIYYFLKPLHLENFDTGSSNPTLNRNHIHKIKVVFPKPHIQQKIAAVLSAYDDLIENNKRRIALLEKMAEEIYREWFVRLRFPGHEKVQLVKGVPEGWEHRKISSFASCKYGFTESAVEDPALPKFLRVMDINKASFVTWSEVPNCPISDSEFHKLRLFLDDIVIARMADPGKVAIIEQEVDAVFASYLIKIAFNRSKITPYYLFYTLRMDAYTGYFSCANSGATRGSINGTLIGNVTVLVPTRTLLEQFEEQVRPFRVQLNSLVRENDLLTKIRDRLLPRLISGKLSVEKLDIQFPPSMADESQSETY